MSDEATLCGILPAIASPCDEDGVFLEDTFAKLVAHLYQEDIDGLYVCGNTGQGPKMKPSERMRAAEIAVALSKTHGGTAMIHVGAGDTGVAVALAEHAAKVGAAAVSSLPPMGADHKQLMDYYSTVAKATELPVVIYHVPVLTKLELDLDDIIQLLEIPGVVGLKYTDWDLFLMRRILLARPETVVFNGYDEFLCFGLAYGASGGIGTWYNVFPELFVAVYNASKAGDYNRAIELQEKMTDFASLVWNNDRGAVFEYLMNRMGFGPHCRRGDRTEMTAEQIKKLEPQLDRAMEAIHAAI